MKRYTAFAKKNRSIVASSVRRHRRPITAATGSYDTDMQKIQYFAKKVSEDIKEAEDILQSYPYEYSPIEIPDLDIDDSFDGFYNWFIEGCPGFDRDEVELTTIGRGRSAINIKYGWFNAEDMLYHGINIEDMLVEPYQYLYYVTAEYYHTIADLANDPYAVFDDVFGDDDYEKRSYAEDVVDTFDLLTYSDRDYSLASDARSFVKLYEAVSDYLSYENAKARYEEYIESFEE